MFGCGRLPGWNVYAPPGETPRVRLSRPRRPSLLAPLERWSFAPRRRCRRCRSGRSQKQARHGEGCTIQTPPSGAITIFHGRESQSHSAPVQRGTACWIPGSRRHRSGYTPYPSTARPSIDSSARVYRLSRPHLKGSFRITESKTSSNPHRNSRRHARQRRGCVPVWKRPTNSATKIAKPSSNGPGLRSPLSTLCRQPPPIPKPDFLCKFK